jgi:S-adenosylmethionine hydrolase
LAILSLTTDFGTKDGNTGVMKGVIWGINPEIQIADLSHYITPQNVREASLVLDRQVWYFPPGTVHVVVVDPGVGTKRRPIASQIGQHFFVGPDNGVFSLLYERAEKNGWPVKIVHTNNSKYWLSDISNVFHGRDIFSPVGAYLASGVNLEDLGEVIDDPIRFDLPQPTLRDKAVVGQVMRIDHFGNIITNIRAEHISSMEDVNVTLCGYTIEGMVKTFGERRPGEIIALFGSTGYLIISEVNGSASNRLSPKIDDFVEVLAS